MTANTIPSQQQNIRLHWGDCAYELSHSKRRSVGFLIRDNGLCIQAPLRLPKAQLESIIHSKADWIQKRLAQWKARQSQSAPLKQLLEQRSPIPVRGLPYLIEALPPKSKPLLNPWTQRLLLPSTDDTMLLEKTAEKLLKAHALDVFKHMAAQLRQKAEKSLELPTFSIHLSSPKSRWGSCNSNREIRLNWRLVHHPLQHIEYVVAHEMAHLLEMNHSPRFWAVLETLMPGYVTPHKTLSNLNPSEVPLQ